MSTPLPAPDTSAVTFLAAYLREERLRQIALCLQHPERGLLEVLDFTWQLTGLGLKVLSLTATHAHSSLTYTGDELSAHPDLERLLTDFLLPELTQQYLYLGDTKGKLSVILPRFDPGLTLHLALSLPTTPGFTAERIRKRLNASGISAEFEVSGADTPKPTTAFTLAVAASETLDALIPLQDLWETAEVLTLALTGHARKLQQEALAMDEFSAHQGWESVNAHGRHGALRP